MRKEKKNGGRGGGGAKSGIEWGRGEKVSELEHRTKRWPKIDENSGKGQKKSSFGVSGGGGKHHDIKKVTKNKQMCRGVKRTEGKSVEGNKVPGTMKETEGGREGNTGKKKKKKGQGPCSQQFHRKTGIKGENVQSEGKSAKGKGIEWEIGTSALPK